jgi:hypothetical protein
MRRGGLRALCLFAVLMVMASLGFADDRTVSLESKVIQTFDTPEEQQWFVIGSKFSTLGYPKISFIPNTWPMSLFGSNPTDPDKKSVLGVALMFDRKEYNWVDILPGTKSTDSNGKTSYDVKEINLPGRVSSFDLWVWGSGFRYYAEVYVRDYRGIVHPINLGMISHEGWKNIRVSIPTSIPQSKQTLPKAEGLKLVKFRIWTTPTEAVAVIGNENTLDIQTTSDKTKEPDISRAIFVYLDQIKILTDMYETNYDGDALANPDNVRKNWNADTKSEGK